MGEGEIVFSLRFVFETKLRPNDIRFPTRVEIYLVTHPDSFLMDAGD
jgi:hypothetical protein